MIGFKGMTSPPWVNEVPEEFIDILPLLAHLHNTLPAHLQFG
jgi:hypothetical protein